jgi:hypothetical protein
MSDQPVATRLTTQFNRNMSQIQTSVHRLGSEHAISEFESDSNLFCAKQDRMYLSFSL